MSLRKDTRYILGKYVLGKDKEYEPKVPDKDIILEQAKARLKKGRTTGNTRLDMEATKALRDDEER